MDDELFLAAGIRGLIAKVRTAPSEALREFDAVLGRDHFTAFEWSSTRTTDQETYLIARLREGTEEPGRHLKAVDDVDWSDLEQSDGESVRIFPCHLRSEEERAMLETPPQDWFWPDSSRPSSDHYPSTCLGAVRVAHIDTGVSPHPCVVGALDKESSVSYFPKKERGKGVFCWGNSMGLDLSIDHGTTTAGLVVGSASDDHNLVEHGMVQRVLIERRLVEFVPYRATKSFTIFVNEIWNVADAIDDAVNKGCEVITISLGAPATTPGVFQRVREALTRAREQGIIVCCAAGQYVPFQVYPAVMGLDGLCISCGGSTPDDLAWSGCFWPFFSHQYVTIAAPANYMPKAGWRNGDCSNPDAAEITQSEGTSYSTAFVAGAAALWRAMNREAIATFPKREIPGLFERSLRQTARAWSSFPWGYSPEKAFYQLGPGIADPNALLQRRIIPRNQEAIITSGARIKFWNDRKGGFMCPPRSRKNWPNAWVGSAAGDHEIVSVSGGDISFGSEVRIKTKQTPYHGYDCLYCSEAGVGYYDQESSNEKQIWTIAKADTSPDDAVRSGDPVRIINKYFPDRQLYVYDGDVGLCTVGAWADANTTNTWRVYSA
jgi:hypothetical protein